jgi:hypothetical protein
MKPGVGLYNLEAEEASTKYRNPSYTSYVFIAKLPTSWTEVGFVIPESPN